MILERQKIGGTHIKANTKKQVNVQPPVKGRGPPQMRRALHYVDTLLMWAEADFSISRLVPTLSKAISTRASPPIF